MVFTQLPGVCLEVFTIFVGIGVGREKSMGLGNCISSDARPTVLLVLPFYYLPFY